MKKRIKAIATITGGTIGALIPIVCAYKLWVWVMTLVPIASEWAGLIKAAITIGLILGGGGLTLACAILIGYLFALIVLAVID